MLSCCVYKPICEAEIFQTLMSHCHQGVHVSMLRGGGTSLGQEAELQELLCGIAFFSAYLGCVGCFSD